MSAVDGHEGEAETVEFRIHGIGNQPPWHALGEPRVVPTTAEEQALGNPETLPIVAVDSATPVGNQPDRFIESFSPPDHSDGIWLINWARTSRRTARFNWFLAIPLTMVNVAGHMRPAVPDSPGRRLLPVAVHVVAAWMTVAVVLWLVVLAETALKYAGAWNLWLLLVRIALTLFVVLVWRVTKGHLPLLGSLVAVVGLGFVWFHPRIPEVVSPFRWEASWWSWDYLVAVLLIGGVGVAGGTLGRRMWGVTKAPLATVIVHSGIALLTTAFVVARPVRWPTPEWLPQWATIRRPSDQTCSVAASFDPTWVCQDTIDLVTMMVVLSTGTTVLLAGLLLAAHFRTASSARRPNLAGAALMLVLGVLVLHAVASISRVGMNWLLDYLDQQRGSLLGGYRWPTPIAFRWLTPTDNSDQFVYRPDLAVLLAAAFLLAVGLVGYAVIRRQWGFPNEPEGASLPHKVVQSLGSTLAPIVGISLLLFIAATAGLGVVMNESHTLPGWVRVLVTATVQASALLLALLYAGRLARFRDVLSRFADVAGFWPVLYHPLAGSSYRPHVLRGIVHEIGRAHARRVVVVGHSQGSVLAACVVGKRFEAAARPTWPVEVRLLTCGSPLASLYQAFFPSEFTADFFTGVQDGAQGHWVNCWRATDGIASALPGCQNEFLPDPRSSTTLPGEQPPRPRGHGDYWTDEGQVLQVHKLGSAASSPTSENEPDPMNG